MWASFIRNISSISFYHFISLLGLIVGVASLAISIFSIIWNRTRIYYTFPDEVEVIEGKNIIPLEKNLIIPNCLSDINIMITLSIVNPFSYDLEFFDLKVIDPEDREKEFFILTQKNIKEMNRGKCSYIDMKQGEQFFYLEIPEDTRGVLKAHSQKSLDIVICPDEPLKQNKKQFFGKKLYVMFQIPVKTFFNKNNYAEKGKERLKWYDHEYDLSKVLQINTNT